VKVDVGGSILDVEVDGPSGAPAILHFNGAGRTLRQWDIVLPRLTDSFRSIRLDMRGVGQSTPAADPSQYSFHQFVDDASKVLDAVGVEKCHIWSMAWGSRVGLAFSATNPDRVISATLNDISTDPADPDAQREGHVKAMKLQAAAGVEPFESPAGAGEHAYPDQVPLAIAANHSGSFDLKAAIPDLTMPVLIVTGDCDPNIVSSRNMAEAAPSARLVELKNVGHGSILQRPDLTTDLFLQFQSQLTA
jgi:pimeloyl-ACP methyl ester carboxylesterase